MMIAGSLWLTMGLSSATELFVAPGGDDTQAGTRDQAFATIHRAQEAARAARKTRPGERVTVTLRGGHYQLDRPLVFSAADSGASPDAPVRYRAADGEEVVLSGGRTITSWQPDPDRPGVWRTRVADPGEEEGSAWRFEQLWVNQQRAVRARTPNYWHFYQLAGDVVEEELADQRGRFQHTFPVRPEQLAPLANLRDTELRDVQVLVFHKWDTTREWLQTISPDEGSFTTFGSKMKHWNRMTRGCIFFFENFLAALDSPGEWFLDRDGWLYYYPRAGEDMVTADVVGPRLDRFVVVQGNEKDPGQWVAHLRFEGLTFRHSEFRIPPEGQRPHQAALSIDSVAVELNGARDVQFDRCAVEHIGSTAFWFRRGCRDCRVERTRMFDLGITGVRIGEQELVPEPIRTGNITVHNCIVHSGGRIMPCAVGIWIGHSADNTITHCDVADFFYTAVSVGWRWGYAESGAKRNTIEWNHLHHIGYRILSDMGAVYTLGPSEGTSVSHNVIHNVYATRYGGWGLYPDEGSTGIRFENNLVYDIRDGGFHQHYGKENLVRNNIFAFSEEGQIAVSRAEPHLSFTFERNIVYWDTGHLLGYQGWKAGSKVIMRNNLYWRAGGQSIDFIGKTFEQWQADGRDAGSIIADPKFVNPGQRDFRFLPDSPAAKIGFVPFDFSRAGVYGDPQWIALAASTQYPEPYVVP